MSLHPAISVSDRDDRSVVSDHCVAVEQLVQSAQNQIALFSAYSLPGVLVEMANLGTSTSVHSRPVLHQPLIDYGRDSLLLRTGLRPFSDGVRGTQAKWLWIRYANPLPDSGAVYHPTGRLHKHLHFVNGMSKRPPPLRKLNDDECRHYRDQLRAARYAALADAEGFDAICFAVEALGLRLLGEQGDLGKYEDRIGFYARQSPVLTELAKKRPSGFKTFESLYQVVRTARNDAMHAGAYARHATEAAIELCIGLEEALMSGVKRTVGSVMVKSPISIEHWQPVAHARQLMLMHSFSNLPLRHQGKWWLLSELALARFLSTSQTQRKERLGLSIEQAAQQDAKLELFQVSERELLNVETKIEDLLNDANDRREPTLWLVIDDAREEHLAGVLSPFELM